MGFLNRSFKKHEDELKEVIAIEPFRDYRANNKFRYKIRTKDSSGTTYSGLLLARATFPEIGQMINLEDWVSINPEAVYKEDWQNMYGLKSISESHEMPKIGEICIDIYHYVYMIYLGVGAFLVLPNAPDGAKASLYNFCFLGGSDFEGAYTTKLLYYGSIIPLGEVLSTSDTLESCKEYVSFSGDALMAINLAIKTLQEQKSEAAKKIDEMAAFNQLYDRKPLEGANENVQPNDSTTCQEEQSEPATVIYGFYTAFIKTKEGQNWVNEWEENFDCKPTYSDYLKYFHPELLK